MTPPDARVIALPAPRQWVKVLPGIGVGLIWAFLVVFLIYPLLRLLYDAFTDDAGRLTLLNFYEFFTDRFYLRSLWNSILLGIGTVLATSILGVAIAFLLVRCDFRGRNLFPT